MKKKIVRWLKIILIIYCLIGISVYYLQDKILYHPRPVPADSTYTFTNPYVEINIPFTTTSTINVIRFKSKDSVVKGVVLYFHGNRWNVAHYADRVPDFTKNNYEVWMIDYPGYGKSTGTFAEQELYDWALILYKLARVHYSSDSIVIYGKSMGTGIATQLASIRDCKELILETPYYSLPSILGTYFPIYPVERMVHIKIPTWQYLQQVTAPVTILHGTKDALIPIRNAKRLLPYLKKEDRFFTIEGGSHNDLSSFTEYQQKLDSLLR
jgi:uncharacterized protein